MKERACRGDAACVDVVDVQAANAAQRQASARDREVRAKSRVKVDALELRHATEEVGLLAQRLEQTSLALRAGPLLKPEELEMLEQAVQQATAWRDAARDGVNEALRAADQAYFAAFGEVRQSRLVGDTSSAAKPLGTLAQGVGSQASTIQILDHGYELIAQLGNETKGYGAYTYVLFPRRVNDSSLPVVPATEQRYKALLDAIVASTLERRKLPTDKAHWHNINLFCIPTLSSNKPGTGLESYSTTIALQYMSLAKGGVLRRGPVMEKLVASAGPFLLTTFVPMNAALSDAPLLLADLADIPNDTFASVLADYKAHLGELRTVRDQQVWQPAIGQRVALIFVRIAPDLAESMKWVKRFVGVGGEEERTSGVAN